MINLTRRLGTVLKWQKRSFEIAPHLSPCSFHFVRTHKVNQGLREDFAQRFFSVLPDATIFQVQFEDYKVCGYAIQEYTNNIKI